MVLKNFLIVVKDIEKARREIVSNGLFFFGKVLTFARSCDSFDVCGGCRIL